MWRISVQDDQGKRTVIPLTRAEYLIGRAAGNVIRLTQHNVSREHARLCHPHEGLFVEDLGSSLGTYVNTQRIATRTPLNPGDMIQIGDYSIQVDREVTPPPPERAESGPARLVMEEGPYSGATFPLIGEKMLVGRGETADIRIDHTSVSRVHCELSALPGGRFDVIDRDSSNGIRWNSQPRKRAILEDGDLLSVGDVTFRFVRASEVSRPPPGSGAIGRAAQSQLVVPVIVFVTVVAIGTVFSWLFVRGHGAW